jgi:hypothetical protein
MEHSSRATLWSQIGKGGDKLVPVLVKDAEREQSGKQIEAFHKKRFHLDSRPHAKNCELSLSRELLKKVKEGGIRIVLATSSDEENAATYKRILGMEDLVEETAAAADAKESKPEPNIFTGQSILQTNILMGISKISKDGRRGICKLMGWLRQSGDRPDEGMWEVRGEGGTGLHSRFMSWVAFNRAIPMTAATGFPWLS